MRRTNKAGDWKELLILSSDDFQDLLPNSSREPAVRVTYAVYGRELRFSYTPGVMSDGAFRPVQHLHHRNLGAYMVLFRCSGYGGLIAQKLGIVGTEVLAGMPDTLKQAIKMAVLENEVIEAIPEKPRPKKKKNPVNHPTFKASIGDMIKAKAKG